MSFLGLVLSFIFSFGLLVIAMTVHEFAHGWVAYKAGDNTAKHSGRLTLNPLAHIDPVWTILVPLSLFLSSGGRFMFGAAKPVPINYWALRNPRRDIILIGASGPIANLIFAFLLSLLIRFAPLTALIHSVFLNLFLINVVLGVFNLMPIPPLDGSRIIMGLLPRELSRLYSSIESYAFVILIILSMSGFFGRILWPVVGYVASLMGVS